MHMRRLFAALLLFASPALAGEIYGTITEAGKPVNEGTAVEGRCGDTAYPAVKTDKAGAYRLVLQEKGKCTLTVRHKGQAPALEVASYDAGVQVDLVLVAENGTYALKRK
jgi:hypothetical protein